VTKSVIHGEKLKLNAQLNLNVLTVVKMMLSLVQLAIFSEISLLASNQKNVLVNFHLHIKTKIWLQVNTSTIMKTARGVPVGAMSSSVKTSKTVHANAMMSGMVVIGKEVNSGAPLSARSLNVGTTQKLTNVASEMLTSLMTFSAVNADSKRFAMIAVVINNVRNAIHANVKMMLAMNTLST